MRITTLSVSLLLLGPIALAAPDNVVSTTPSDVRTRALIDRAGNGEEAERGAILEQIAAANSGDAALKSDANRLATVAKRWVELSTWREYLREEVPASDSCEGVAPSSPLHTIACFYEARSLTWLAIEGTDDPSLDVRALKRARRLLEAVVKAYPRNRIAQQYLGARFPTVKSYPAAPEAPAWANLQREGLERLTDIIEWWIDQVGAAQSAGFSMSITLGQSLWAGSIR